MDKKYNKNKIWDILLIIKRVRNETWNVKEIWVYELVPGEYKNEITLICKIICVINKKLTTEFYKNIIRQI